MCVYVFNGASRSTAVSLNPNLPGSVAEVRQTAAKVRRKERLRMKPYGPCSSPHPVQLQPPTDQLFVWLLQGEIESLKERRLPQNFDCTSKPALLDFPVFAYGKEVKTNEEEWKCRKGKEKETTQAVLSSVRFSIVCLNKPVTGVTV